MGAGTTAPIAIVDPQSRDAFERYIAEFEAEQGRPGEARVVRPRRLGPFRDLGTVRP